MFETVFYLIFSREGFKEITVCCAHTGCQGSFRVWQWFIFDAKAVKESLAAESGAGTEETDYRMDEG